MLQRPASVTEGSRLCGDEWHFQQDNIAIHNARHTLTFLQENGVRVLGHRACSPDSNPNVWGWMVRNVYSNGKLAKF